MGWGNLCGAGDMSMVQTQAGEAKVDGEDLMLEGHFLKVKSTAELANRKLLCVLSEPVVLCQC